MSVDDLPVTTAPTRAAPAPAAAPPAAVEPDRAPAPAPSPAPSGGWGLPLVVLIVGMFMSILDTSIVNVAIPTMQNAFGTTTDEIQWIATSYTLVLGVVVPLSAWLSDRFGPARTYNVALLTFAAGSALCGLAWNLESMVVFRIVQAIPGGILPVVTLSMVYRIVPREKIGAAMGMYGLGIIVAPAIGPTLGGYLVEYVDWRLIFFINVPIGILGAIAAVMVLPTFPAVKSQKFDVLGFLTIAGGLFALLLALSEGPVLGLDGLPRHQPAVRFGDPARPVRDHRARGRAPAAGRPGVQVLAVHELAAADLGADGRPVRHAVLHPAVPPAGPGPRRVRRGRPPVAAGARHGRADADRRAALRQDRPALARGDRAHGRGHRHLRCCTGSRWTSARARSPRCSRCARAGWAWR